LKDSYYEQAAGLMDGGVDLLQVETAQDLLQIKAALVAIFKAQKEKAKTGGYGHGDGGFFGADAAGNRHADAHHGSFQFSSFSLGLNCGDGPQTMVEALRILKKNSPFLISALPNAGARPSKTENISMIFLQKGWPQKSKDLSRSSG